MTRSDRISARPRPEDWPADAAMRLEEAAAVFGLDYPITVSTLRTEIRKGRLTPAKVAGTFTITPAQIRDLYKPCPAEPKALASTSSSAPAARPSGSSGMDRLSAAQAAARIAVERLKSRSPLTSPTNGRVTTESRNVIPMTPARSASRKS